MGLGRQILSSREGGRQGTGKEWGKTEIFAGRGCIIEECIVPVMESEKGTLGICRVPL